MNKSIFFILLFTLIITLSANSQDTLIVDRIIATIGSKIVLNSDLQTVYSQMKAQGVNSENPECEIYEDLLFQKLLLNQAELDSIEVTEEEVELELVSRLDLYAEQMGGYDALEDYYNKTTFEIKEEFRELIEEQLLTQRMQYSITENIKVTPAEVREFYENTPKDSLPIVDTQYEIQVIRIYPKVTEEETNIAIEKLEGFKEKIESGEKTFESLAKWYSEDDLSAKSGGELGFMGRGELDADFAAAAFSLEEDEISDVVKSAFGYHIIQLIERKGEKMNCRHILVSPKVSTTANIDAKEKLDSIKTFITTDSLTFEEAATIYSEDEDSNKNNGLMINPYTGVSKFEEASISPTIKYVVTRMEVGEISKPTENIDNSGVICYDIYKLKAKTEYHIANLEQDYQDIMALALVEKQQDVINKWIKEKQRTVYVHIDDEYKSCPFQFSGWLK